MNRKNFIPHLVELAIFGTTIVLLSLTGVSKAASADQLPPEVGTYSDQSNITWDSLDRDIGDNICSELVCSR